LVESLDIGGHSLGILVMSSVVNGDSDGLGEGGGESGSLQLSERETSAEFNLVSISSGLAVADWPKLGDGGNSSSSCLGGSSLSPEGLVSGLVEEALNSSHPMFPQVRALNDIIV